MQCNNFEVYYCIQVKSQIVIKTSLKYLFLFYLWLLTSSHGYFFKNLETSNHTKAAEF